MGLHYIPNEKTPVNFNTYLLFSQWSMNQTRKTIILVQSLQPSLLAPQSMIFVLALVNQTHALSNDSVLKFVNNQDQFH